MAAFFQKQNHTWLCAVLDLSPIYFIEPELQYQT